MNALVSEGVQVTTDEDRNHLSGSIRLRIRARFSLYKRRVTNKFRRRDHIAVKINDNVQHIRLSINNLKFESNNKEVMSDNQEEINIIQYELSEIIARVNKIMSIQID